MLIPGEVSGKYTPAARMGPCPGPGAPLGGTAVRTSLARPAHSQTNFFQSETRPPLGLSTLSAHSRK